MGGGGGGGLRRGYHFATRFTTRLTNGSLKVTEDLVYKKSKKDLMKELNKDKERVKKCFGIVFD